MIASKTLKVKSLGEINTPVLPNKSGNHPEKQINTDENRLSLFKTSEEEVQVDEQEEILYLDQNNKIIKNLEKSAATSISGQEQDRDGGGATEEAEKLVSPVGPQYRKKQSKVDMK